MTRSGDESMPELEATIEAAIDELDRSASEAKLHEDPLRLPLAALASFLRAQRRLYLNATVTLAAQIASVQQPISAAEISRLNAAAARHAAGELPRAVDRLVIQRFVWMAAIMVGIGVAAGISLYELGRRVGHGEQAIETGHTVDALATAASSHGGTAAAEQWLSLMRDNDITRSPRTCFKQENRAACAIVLWMETPPPPAGGQEPDATGSARKTTTPAGRSTERNGRR